MTKLIVGSYLFKEDAIKAVNIYELTGHQAKNIIILTNHENKSELEKLTDVTVKDYSPEHAKKVSLRDRMKIKVMHYANVELDTHEKLVDYGLSIEDAEKCMTDVQMGKIVVLADDELRMGQV